MQPIRFKDLYKINIDGAFCASIRCANEGHTDCGLNKLAVETVPETTPERERSERRTPEPYVPYLDCQ